MPTYEYKCKSCGKMSEFFQSMTAKPMRKCPVCGKSALERQIGIGAAIVFKGSGFYQTDYRSESYKKAAEAESKAGSGTSGGEVPSKPDQSAGSKPESKPEAKPQNQAEAASDSSATGSKSGSNAVRVGSGKGGKGARGAASSTKSGAKRRAGRA